MNLRNPELQPGDIGPDYCGWLIRVASNNPEPDSPEDCYAIIACGGELTFNEYGSWACEHGHEHVSHSDPRREAWEAEQAFIERGQR